MCCCGAVAVLETVLRCLRSLTAIVLAGCECTSAWWGPKLEAKEAKEVNKVKVKEKVKEEVREVLSFLLTALAIVLSNN